jgi:cell division protein FtsQ
MTVVDAEERFATATRTSHRGRWIALAAAVVVVAFGAWLVWFSSVLSAREVRVLGAVSVSADSIRQAAAVPVGQQLARVDVGGISARVGAIPRVASVEVRRGWPDVLVVVVTERTPLVVVRDGADYTFVDATGARFGSVAVPPRGMPTVAALGEPALASALDVVAALPDDVRAAVTRVVARTRDDVVLSLPGGATVQWGSAEESARKLEVLRALLRVGARHYDVSAPDLPTTAGTLAPSASPSTSPSP